MVVENIVEKVRTNKGRWRAIIFFRNLNGKTKKQRRCQQVTCYGMTKKDALENAELQVNLKKESN